MSAPEAVDEAALAAYAAERLRGRQVASEPVCETDNETMVPCTPATNRSQVVLAPPSAPAAVVRQIVAARYLAGDVFTLRRWRGGYWRWMTSRWVELEESAMRSELYAITEHALYANGDGKLVDWSPNRRKVSDLVDALAAVTYLDEHVRPPTWLGGADDPPAGELVSAANGLVHVPTRRRHDHNPRLFNQVSVPFAYDADAALPGRWLKFLAELWPADPDSIAALQEYVGYVISGRTDLHKILLVVGPTRAGKGVIARVLKHLIGDGNHAGPTLASLGTNFGLAPLIGKPLAIVSDARLTGNTSAVVERLLSVSGQDMLTVDIKYRQAWTGTLPTRFVVISNELPHFRDASGAIANRFVILSLTHSWLGQENPDLTDELLGELSGIFNWALDGLARLHSRGRFTEPQASTDALMTLMDSASPTAAYVRDRCHVSAGEEVACDDLYRDWKTWAEDNGHHAGNTQALGRNLRAAVPGVKVVRPTNPDGTKMPRRYQGLRRLHAGESDNGRDRGPSRSDTGFGPSDRDGPRSTPLWAERSEVHPHDAETATDEVLG